MISKFTIVLLWTKAFMNEIFVTQLWADIDKYAEAVGLIQDTVI